MEGNPGSLLLKAKNNWKWPNGSYGWNKVRMMIVIDPQNRFHDDIILKNRFNLIWCIKSIGITLECYMISYHMKNRAYCLTQHQRGPNLRIRVSSSSILLGGDFEFYVMAWPPLFYNTFLMSYYFFLFCSSVIPPHYMLAMLCPSCSWIPFSMLLISLHALSSTTHESQSSVNHISPLR